MNWSKQRWTTKGAAKPAQPKPQSAAKSAPKKPRTRAEKRAEKALKARFGEVISTIDVPPEKTVETVELAPGYSIPKYLRECRKKAAAARIRTGLDHWYGDGCDPEGENPGHVSELLDQLANKENNDYATYQAATL